MNRGLLHKAIEIALIYNDNDFTIEEIQELQDLQDYLLSDEE